MDQATRREPTMESQGYLGNSRVILNHFDAATQADIQHTALSYESEDETMGRSRSRRHCQGSGPPLYSKQDIREQYCISERGLGALERGGGGGGLFGCLAGAGTHATSPCAAAARGNLLTVCVRRRVPSDENIHELCRRQPEDYAPMPRYPRYPWGPTPAELYRYETELECSYFRRRPRSLCGSAPDPTRYTWLPADEEAGRLERPRPVPVRHDLDLRHSAEALAHFGQPPPPPPAPHAVCLVHPLPMPMPIPMPPPAIAHHDPAAVHRPKHVSFARSHTLTSFDDAVVSIGGCGGSGGSGRLARSQERLLDGRKTADPAPITKQPEPSESQRVLVMEKIKRAPMKTQATQTEVCLGRKPIPSAQLTLSPRTIHRVKMVSQGAQTNGVVLTNGRKLMKSYSEAGGKFNTEDLETLEHEPLQRTQSEEPPRSPFIVKTPSPEPEPQLEPEAEVELEEPIPEPLPQPVQVHQPVTPLPSLSQNDETSSVTKSDDHDSEDSETKSQKEIIIDFEPQIPSLPLKKKPLLKTSSDGEILLDKRRAQRQAEDAKFFPDKNLTSISHDNISVEPEPRTFTPYFQNSPIRHEDIFKDLNNGHPIFSSVENDENDTSIFRTQDSIDEEFHENLIYGGLFQKHSSSSDPEGHDSNSRNASNSPSPEEDGVVPTLHLLPDKKVSPFASTDSLVNDLRDHSDGIWNESQATVLQADSGTENGTGLSASELSSTLSPGTATLLTPSSRRKHLLLQHQQRSSMDTDALDEESQGDTQQQSPLPRPVSPRTIKEPPNISLLAPPLSEPLLMGPLPRRIPGSPGRVRRTPEPPPPGTERGFSDSALELRGLNGAAIVPDLLLARTDSGRTNTDISESTTTDDYMTANSGTDSSRRSGSFKGTTERHHHHPVTQEGSSFESASSMYSIARGDLLAEDMVVPSFSPPPILEEVSDAAATPVPGPGRISRSRSASSSSSGSYSLDGGSCPDLAEPSRTVPSPRHVPSVSDDERSAHYSSSGYYESPLEDDSACKTSRLNPDKREWTDEEKRRKKRTFTLEFTKHQLEDQKSYSGEKLKSLHSHKTAKDMEAPPQISPRTLTTSVTDKQLKRSRRNRSPMQGRRVTVPHVNKRSPPGTKTPEVEEHIVTTVTGAATSDESSSGVCGDVQIQAQNQSSPRKVRKIREGNRRKSTPRSPTSARVKRRNGNGEDKPTSLPGSLPRRRTKHESTIEENHSNTLPATKSNRLSPYKSPSGSPNKRRSSKTSPEVRLKALSAESLRSVSPGSDSVFYSDPSSHTAAPPPPTEHQVHCLHCGKEVDIVTTDDPDKSNASSNGAQPDIVQPPAGFADSPRLKHGRLYKKLEKRFRSEDRTHAEKKHHKYRSDVRAKSEERCGRESETSTWATGCTRARSASGGSVQLRGAGSSPSVLGPTVDIHEDDNGLYDEPYHSASWLYLGDSDEAYAWNKSESNIPQGGASSAAAPAGGPSAEEQEMSRRDSLVSTASTDSEHEFKKRYRAVTQRMVHRKSCLEMYKRQASKSFVDADIEDNDTLKKNLQELLKLMLMVWCKENEANKLYSGIKNESDKTIVVRRESGEFGFRIHGSKPVVVSAIEPDTPAESSGLEVGDIVLAVNGVSVLDKSHSEVVKIAHAGSDTLTLEVARTCGILSPPSSAGQESTSLYSGYLWKQGGHASGTHSNKWIRRWFCLKKDNCLYTYKTDLDQQPVGAMMLHNYIIDRIADDSPGASPRPHRICLRRSDSSTVPFHLAADNETAASRWTNVLTSAAERAKHTDMWLEQTRRLLASPPAQLARPDCFGYLNKLGTKWKTWNRRYCVLKDACMYFYQDANAKCSFGMACLHGYRVQQSTASGKKHAFEILPSDTAQKHFYFHTETEMDRKRWLAALEYSIDRWLKVG